jgi:uncharacterized GH25 family protein
MMRFAVSLLVVISTKVLFAHDVWIEANVPLVRAGDAVYLDLKLGNHGNDHRDFKLAGKTSPSAGTVDVILPDGRKLDLKPQLADVGYAPNEGFWTAKFVPAYAGTYLAAFSSDTVVNHGRPVRSLKSAKTYFLATTTLDRVQDSSDAWRQPLKHPVEIVLLSHPVLFTGPGMPIEVQVLRFGQPFPDARVSFIPQGVELQEGFDETYERRTDAQGKAKFVPKTGARMLIAVHHKADHEQGAHYESTSYSATLYFTVPELCPCCQ